MRATTVLGTLLVLAVAAALVASGAFARSTARIAQLEQRYDSLAAAGRGLDTVYVTQRDTLWRRIASVDTLVETVSAWKHDTVEVVRFVERADSVITECKSVILSCEERVANRDLQIATLTDLRVEDRKAARRAQWRTAGIAVVAWEGVRLLLRAP
jgi:hypothetical protein